MTNHKDKVDGSAVVTLQRHWGWLLSLGLLLLILGCIGLGMQIALTLVSMYFFAALLLVSGISHGVDACKHKPWKGACWQIFIALLYFIAAGLVFYDPLLASAMLTAALAWLLIVIGFARIIMSIYVRDTKGWGWIFFSGITSLVLGVLILLQWPMSGLWVIGMFIAIDMIVSGWTYIFTAFALRCSQGCRLGASK